MEKKYISQTNNREPRPRSKRLREQGIGSTNSTIVMNSAAGSAVAAQQGDGHTHGNKPDLDQISTDSEGYEYLTRLKPVTVVDEETGEETTVYERVKEKVKAGYADKAGALAEDSPILQQFLSKVNDDTAQGLITFIQGLVSEGKITAKQGVEIGSFVTGLIGGSGARIDKDGNGELESLVIRQFLEVPELRFNRIDVVSGELWNSICFGTIEAVDTKKRIVTLKLQDGELSGIEVGDICRGIFHCLESSNPSADMAEDECGFQQMAGFSTSYFTPTEVYDDGARFKYSLRSGTSVHPQVGMKFAVYGSFTNPARRASAYHTRTYTRYLNAVDTWRISPDKNIYGQQGNLEGLTINEMEMHGYGGYFHNIYMSGVHVEFDRDWLDHNLPKVYSVHLTTYEHTIVTDIEGNPLNGLEELRNVITGESNVMSGDDNVIATRLAVTTTILAHKGTTPLLYSDTMDEGRFIVTLACVGCTAEVDNGVVKVTSIDKDSAEHRVDISVNCEGEGVYVQTFNIPVVKQGENGITADLDNEMASIAANDKGEPLVVPFEEIVSHGRMWYGNEPMYLTSAEVAVPGGITVEVAKTETDSEGNHNYLPIDSEHKQCTLRITKVDASAADTNEIRLSLTGKVKPELNTEYSKTVVFKLNKVRMGENALNYQLLPSVTEIKATAEGVLSERYISCGVTASDGKSLTQLSSLDGTGLSMNYVVYYSANSWSSEKSYTINGNLSLSDLGITKDSVRIVFYLKWNSVLIDKEGVPVVANGEKGDDGNGISSVTVRFNAGTDYRFAYCSWKSTWTSNSPDVDYTYKYLWKRTTTVYTDKTEETIYECVGKIGDKGIDGNGVDYAYYLSDSSSAPAKPSGTTPVTTNPLRVTPNTWTDDPQGVSSEYPYEWICEMKQVAGVWQGYGAPVLWAKYGEDGETTEYIYKVTSTNEAPDVPTSPSPITTNVRGQWTDEPQGVSESQPFEWVSEHKKVLGVWGSYTAAKLWSKWSDDGKSYWFESPVGYVSLGASGSYVPTSLTVTLKKKEGNGEIVDCTDFYNITCWGLDESGNYTRVNWSYGSPSSVEFKVSSNASKYVAFVITAAKASSDNWSKYAPLVSLTIPIAQKRQDNAGTALIDRGIFTPGDTYEWKYDESRGCWLRDMVLYKVNGTYKRYGVKNMGGSTSSYPTSTNNWEELSTYQCVIADTIFGDAANIGGFITNDEKMTSKSNNLTLDGKNGNITISGKLKATDAEITGVITATSGSITGNMNVTGSLTVGTGSTALYIKQENNYGKIVDASGNGLYFDSNNNLTLVSKGDLQATRFSFSDGFGESYISGNCISIKDTTFQNNLFRVHTNAANLGITLKGLSQNRAYVALYDVFVGSDEILRVKLSNS